MTFSYKFSGYEYEHERCRSFYYQSFFDLTFFYRCCSFAGNRVKPFLATTFNHSPPLPFPDHRSQINYFFVHFFLFYLYFSKCFVLLCFFLLSNIIDRLRDGLRDRFYQLSKFGANKEYTLKSSTFFDIYGII